MTIELKPEGIAAEMKQSRRWVRWALCDVQDGEKLRKEMKPPYQANGKPAKHNDSSTWGTYEEVLAAHEASVPLELSSTIVKDHGVRGIGLVIGPPFFGIDLDDCRDAATGALTPEAEEWVSELNTLTEISPSGEGLHLWCHGEPPYPEGHRKDGREIYSTNRYLTVTGHVLTGRAEIRRFQKDEVKRWYDRIKAGRSSDKSSEHVAESGTSGTYTAAKIADLMQRTDFPDQSQAVQSLLTLLAIEHICDVAKVEEEFKKSKLYTETHWGAGDDPKWSRLRESELAKAVGHARDNLQKQRAKQKPEADLELAVRDADKTEIERTVWLWEGWLSRGDLHGSFGDSKEGKSPVWCDLAAVLTTGRDFPDGTKNTHGPLNVILCNCEDNFERKTLPRFLAAGGDPARLVHIDGVRPKNSTLRARVIALDESTSLIRKYLQEQKEQGREFALFVLDPITSLLGKMKYTDHQQTRRVMDPLADLATEFNLAVVIVNHFNRNTDTTSPQYRTLGGGLYQVCRQVLLHTRPEDADTNNENERYRHVLSEDRNQEVDSIEYATEKVPFTFKGQQYEVICIRWGNQLKVRSEGLMDQTSNQDKSLYARLAIELRNYLKGRKDGDLASNCVAFIETCFPEIKGRKGFKWDRVRSKAGIVTGKDGKANRWCLSESETGKLFTSMEARKTDDAPSY